MAVAPALDTGLCRVQPLLQRSRHVGVSAGNVLVYSASVDPIFSRVKDEGIEFYADPGQSQSGEINTRWGGRGFYFRDPDGHSMEVLTRRYGSV